MRKSLHWWFDAHRCAQGSHGKAGEGLWGVCRKEGGRCVTSLLLPTLPVFLSQLEHRLPEKISFWGWVFSAWTVPGTLHFCWMNDSYFINVIFKDHSVAWTLLWWNLTAHDVIYILPGRVSMSKLIISLFLYTSLMPVFFRKPRSWENIEGKRKMLKRWGVWLDFVNGASTLHLNRMSGLDSLVLSGLERVFNNNDSNNIYWQPYYMLGTLFSIWMNYSSNLHNNSFI